MTDTLIDPENIPAEERMPETVYVPLDAISFDYKNPNAMAEGALERLIESIRTMGFFQPCVLVSSENVPEIETDKPYIMVDGFHRWKAVAALGWSTVPCVIAEDLEVATTLALRLGMNQNRGQTDLTIAATQVFELKEEYGYDLDQLVATGFSEQEIGTMLDLASPDSLETVDPSELATAVITDDEHDPGAAARPFLLEVMFSDKAQRAAVKRALKKAGNGDATVGLLALTGVEE